jgi:hypothetical protein
MSVSLVQKLTVGRSDKGPVQIDAVQIQFNASAIVFHKEDGTQEVMAKANVEYIERLNDDGSSTVLFQNPRPIDPKFYPGI